MFTDGENRFYESLMQQRPSRKQRHSGKLTSDYKYKYADMSCDFCPHRKKCVFDLCPYIMENLDDLAKDKAFRHAVADAQSCTTGHKQTLLHLQAHHQF